MFKKIVIMLCSNTYHLIWIRWEKIKFQGKNFSLSWFFDDCIQHIYITRSNWYGFGVQSMHNIKSYNLVVIAVFIMKLVVKRIFCSFFPYYFLFYCKKKFNFTQIKLKYYKNIIKLSPKVEYCSDCNH